jgi:hypothetical protein
MTRHLRYILALAAILALSVTGVASAAKTLTITPKKAGPKSIVTVTVKNAKVKQAFKKHGELEAELTPPAPKLNADGELEGCNIHHPPQGKYLSAAKGAKIAKYRMDPGDALAGPGRWCKGTWKVRLYAQLDQTSDTTDSGRVEITLARTSFVAKG